MLFERPDAGERAVLVHLDLDDAEFWNDPAEFAELVRSAGGEPAEMVSGRRAVPHARTFIGSGKLAEVAAAVERSCASLVLFNHTLSPSQERNLERELRCRVLDRTGLILDIFAQRARTHEGKLQVELAQLQHMATRLVRGWTHLERQKGGIGLRGPGETQLETDRRLLRARVKAIQKRLERVRQQRAQGRRARRRRDLPAISLVGYTNAGKSTLFNALTTARVYAADQLFATLDPTLRRVDVPELGPVVMADTVGFIRHLPHRLVEAFRATLEEAAEADLLVHVIDAADPERDLHSQQVLEVLESIGAGDIPRLEVYNKVDLLGQEPRIDYGRESGGCESDEGSGVEPRRVWLSAARGSGLELLREALAQSLGGDMLRAELLLAPRLGRLRARLFDAGAVLDEHTAADGSSQLSIHMPAADYRRLVRAEQLDPDALLAR